MIFVGFQSTCPARGTTPFKNKFKRQYRYFNPRAPRGARPRRYRVFDCDARFQSTCPARGTTPPKLGVIGSDAISIHVPREGHDSSLQSTDISRLPFQSTCPARGTTWVCIAAAYQNFGFQSTCPARGTTPRRANAAKSVLISIHVPREGHDGIITGIRARITDFNPRAPRGARPGCFCYAVRCQTFQSTCPARGTTRRDFTANTSSSHFNPRAPRGARLL